ncbi:MAG: YtxH domain-containing protein [Chloroflexota bacterium]|nr:YtxH domain-containing protein [Chloroflexota bacterium]
MSAAKRLLRFGGGSILGAGVGTAVAILLAPRGGDELKGRVRDRLQQAKLDGAEAKAAKEAQLIEKFRLDVEDPGALSEEAAQARQDIEAAHREFGVAGQVSSEGMPQVTNTSEADSTVPRV